MIKTTFYIGLNDKETKQQEISTIDAFKIITNILTDGATIKGNCKGIYKHKNGEQVIEETIEAFCFGLNDEKTQNIVDVLKKVLNQESILVIVENVNSRFM